MTSLDPLERLPADAQTPELCLAAIKKNPASLRFVANQTPELCWKAVNLNPRAIRYVAEQTESLCIAAAQLDGLVLDDVRQHSFEVCLCAVINNGASLGLILYPSDKLIDPASKQLEHWVKFLRVCTRTDDISIERRVRRLIMHIPLGKQVMNEWQQPAANGGQMLDLLVELAGEMRRLVPFNSVVNDFCHQVHQHVERALTAKQAPVSRERPDYTSDVTL